MMLVLRTGVWTTQPPTLHQPGSWLFCTVSNHQLEVENWFVLSTRLSKASCL